MSLAQQLYERIGRYRDQIACIDHDSDGGILRQLSYGELTDAVSGLVNRLRDVAAPGHIVPRPIVGLVIRNSCDWLIADLACLFADVTSLPLPQAFTQAQAAHLAAKCEFLLVDEAGAAVVTGRWELDIDKNRLLRVGDTASFAHQADLLTDPSDAGERSICKIIHTSGTTSRPKGVCLSEAAIMATLTSLQHAMPATCHRRYLSLVPLSLLLEQITALYMPLLAGGCVHFLPPGVPLLGEPGSNPDQIIDWLEKVAPSAATVPPVVVNRLLARLRGAPDRQASPLWQYLLGDPAPHLTCGGAAVSPAVLAELGTLGVTIYQGYGLSENASVVSVNTRQANRVGSVGRPLPHVNVRVADDASIQINSTSLFSHYSGEDPSACAVTDDGWLDTGDLGELDEDGYLYIRGRKKNVICLPNGRNVSPEQIEIGLRQVHGIHDAVVFLDDDDGLIALLNTHDSPDDSRLLDWLHTHLSDIERPSRLWIVPRVAELLARLYTVTGRPQRGAIAESYRTHRVAPSAPTQENPHEYGRFVAV